MKCMFVNIHFINITDLKTHLTVHCSIVSANQMIENIKSHSQGNVPHVHYMCDIYVTYVYNTCNTHVHSCNTDIWSTHILHVQKYNCITCIYHTRALHV